MQLTDIKFSLSRAGSHLTPKLIRVMRLTTVLLLTACLHVSAKIEGQTVTLDFTNVPIQKVIDEASKQSGISIIYNETLFAGLSPVTVKLKDATIQDVLKACLKDQPFIYSFEGNLIVIKKEASSSAGLKPADSLASSSLPPPIDIRGRVSDSLGNPLAGASVSIKGSKRGTTTDANGNFTLVAVKDNTTLIISYTGYSSKQFKTGGKGEIAIFLNKSNSPLDEIQVIAYGTTTQRFSTGNISTVQAADIAKQPVNNPLLALEGRVPGLFITQGNGVPGSSVTVQIQGQNSLINGNNPFYVVDGVPYFAEMLSTFSSGFSNEVLGGNSGTNSSSVGSPLNFINPADIESITVLKDADATAIYGSRAANGAIIITTKKGKAGPTQVQIGLQTGWGTPASKLKMMNTEQYLTMRHEALKNDNDIPNSSRDYDILGLYGWDTTRSTDWQKVLIGGTAHFNNINATVSGGTGQTQFIVGGTYQNETSVFPGNFADKRGAIHFNINTTSPNQRFKFQFSGSYMNDDNHLPRHDLTATALSLAPTAPLLYNPDGTLNWALKNTGSSSWNNPLAYTIASFESKTDNLISSSQMSYRLLSGLDISANFGYAKLVSNTYIPYPLNFNAPQNIPYSLRIADYSYNTTSTWLIEPQLNYKKAFDFSKLELLLGGTFQQNTSEGQALEGTGYNSDVVLPDIRSASSISATSSLDLTYRYSAFFGRINYIVKDKFIFDLSGRRDGSSRFGTDNQFHNFGALGIAWIFSEEKFIRNNLTFLSFGKLRASYGTTGSDQIGDYTYLNLYNPVAISPIVPYQGQLGIEPLSLPNPHLQWEETKKLQGGLELGFIKDRIFLVANYIVNRTSNQLLYFPLPIVTGFTSISSNLPATVQNTAWELVLNTVNIKSGDFIWKTNFNITIPNNKLVAYPDLATSPYADIYTIGKPINITKAFHFLGVDPATGIYEFADHTGHATKTPDYTVDRTVDINNFPSFYGGLLNTFNYKGFELDIFFQFTDRYQPNTFGGIPGGTPGLRRLNQPVTVLGRWEKQGDITSIQRFSTMLSPNAPSLIEQYGDLQSSDAGITSSFYVRLKNISLSYQVPVKFMQEHHLQSCQLFIHAQNLLTFTNFNGLDPETGNGVLPPMKVVTVGIQLGL